MGLTLLKSLATLLSCFYSGIGKRDAILDWGAMVKWINVKLVGVCLYISLFYIGEIGGQDLVTQLLGVWMSPGGGNVFTCGCGSLMCLEIDVGLKHFGCRALWIGPITQTDSEIEVNYVKTHSMFVKWFQLLKLTPITLAFQMCSPQTHGGRCLTKHSLRWWEWLEGLDWWVDWNFYFF